MYIHRHTYVYIYIYLHTHRYEQESTKGITLSGFRTVVTSILQLRT